MSPPNLPPPPDPARPSGTDGDVDTERRALVLAGLGALPVLAAGCGGGSAPDAPRAVATAQAALPQAAAPLAARTVRRKPTVGLLGAVTVTAPPAGTGAPTSAFWITVDAGTDARAVDAMAGTGGEVARLELPVDPTQGTLLTLQTDRAVRSVHVARAGQTGYVIGNGARLTGATVVRWDFDTTDDIRRLEILAHPPLAATEGIALECVGLSTGAAG